MARVKGGTRTSRRHRKILRLARGYQQGRHRLFRRANEAVTKALEHSYRDRRNRKRDFRKLWIQRINAAARMYGYSYSVFVHGLTVAGIDIDRKMLADVAARDITSFGAIVDAVKAAGIAPNHAPTATTGELAPVTPQKHKPPKAPRAAVPVAAAVAAAVEAPAEAEPTAEAFADAEADAAVAADVETEAADAIEPVAEVEVAATDVAGEDGGEADAAG